MSGTVLRLKAVHQGMIQRRSRDAELPGCTQVNRDVSVMIWAGDEGSAGEPSHRESWRETLEASARARR